MIEERVYRVEVGVPPDWLLAYSLGDSRQEQYEAGRSAVQPLSIARTRVCGRSARPRKNLRLGPSRAKVNKKFNRAATGA